MLAHNHPAFHQLHRLCPGESRQHRHEAWGIKKDKTFATSDETAFPFMLARDIANVFISILLQKGVDPPPQLLTDLTSQSEQVLQALRAQTGSQPRAARLPPLVPEFKHFVTRMTSSSQDSVPQAKLVSSNPFISSRMKGGGNCDSLESRDKGSSANVNQSSSSLSEHEPCDSMREVWGVYHDPLEFVQKAVEAGHPQNLHSCLPEVLRQAVIVNANSTEVQRARSRTELMKRWRRLAIDLEPEERKLKASMPSHLQGILKDKKIKLWESLLRDANYPDMRVVDELIQGTKLTGETEFCGLWPAKFSPSMVTEEELAEISVRDKWATLERVANSPNPETDQQVWEKTIAERDRGWIVGPLEPSEVPDGYTLSRRFGVVQGPKVRCVDDFTRSSVNLAVQVTESPKPHTVDVLGALISETIKQCRGGGPWAIRPFDLKDAYRQCGVSSSSTPHSHIVVRDPVANKARIFRMLALPFGSVKSVHAFLRVSHSIWFILVHYLSILTTNYFDDFVVLARQSESKHLTAVIHGVLKLLGWSFAEEGAKAPDFAPVANALGVSVNVTNMHLGTVEIDNTSSRKEDLAALVREVLDKNSLSSIDALKLRGRMQFTAGQLFGRAARMCLNQVTHHAYRSNKSVLEPDTSIALQRYREFLLSGKPRSITSNLGDTWFVYTDASYEPDENGASAGFGGVLVDPSGAPVRYFSFDLAEPDIKLMNPSGKKTIIYECEFFAVSVAFDVWSNLLQGKQVVFFIDNNAVRDSLISCKSSGAVASCLLEHILQEESHSSIISWFARVPSKSNIADDPSRGQTNFLAEQKCSEDPINKKRKLEWLDANVRRETEASCVPIHQSKKKRA